jgi:hypothetical protein
MISSFKGRNSAVATAVALAVSSAVGSAAQLSVTPVALSTEAMATTLVTNVVQSPIIDIQLKQNYDNEQLLVLTFDGFTVSAIDQAANVICGVTAADVAVGTPEKSFVDFAVQSSTANTVTLRATGRTANTTDQHCRIPANTIKGSPAQFASETSATFTTKGTNVAGTVEFDQGTTATAVFVSRNQFTAGAVTGLNGVINVNANRGEFTDLRSDTLTFEFTNNSATRRGFNGTAGENAEAVSYSFTLSGDFSFVDDDDVAGCTRADVENSVGTISVIARSAGVAVPAANVTITNVAANCDSLLITVTPELARPNADTTYELSLTFAKTTSLGSSYDAGNWSVASSVRYQQDSSASAGYGTKAAGSWSYNGFVAVVPFMPFQTGYSNTMYLSNRSGQAGGDITVQAFVEGAAPCTFTIPATSLPSGNLLANRTVNIGGQVKNRIRSECPAFGSGNLRATLVVTSPLPAATTELVTQYTDTVGGRTVPIINSSNVYRNR